VNNANHAWIQHSIHHILPVGVAEFVMANSASDARSSEQELRRQLIESRAVDVMVAIGPNIFCGVKCLPNALRVLPISHDGNRNEIVSRIGIPDSSTAVSNLTSHAPSSSLPLLSESCSIWPIGSDPAFDYQAN
jgi:hypothetical protein